MKDMSLPGSLPARHHTQEDTPWKIKPKNPTILQIAWTRFAQMNTYQQNEQKSPLRFRRWLGALEHHSHTSGDYHHSFPSDNPSLISVVFKFLLIMTPILFLRVSSLRQQIPL